MHNFVKKCFEAKDQLRQVAFVQSELNNWPGEHFPRYAARKKAAAILSVLEMPVSPGSARRALKRIAGAEKALRRVDLETYEDFRMSDVESVLYDYIEFSS